MQCLDVHIGQKIFLLGKILFNLSSKNNIAIYPQTVKNVATLFHNGGCVIDTQSKYRIPADLDNTHTVT